MNETKRRQARELARKGKTPSAIARSLNESELDVTSYLLGCQVVVSDLTDNSPATTSDYSSSYDGGSSYGGGSDSSGGGYSGGGD